MRFASRLFFVTSSALALAGCSASTMVPHASGAGALGKRVLAAPLGVHSLLPGPRQRAVTFGLCTPTHDHSRAACLATIRTDGTRHGIRPDVVNGLTPSDLSLLYAYPAPGAQGTAGQGVSVAIVVAGDYANAESDLAVYRSYFGLPPCSSQTGCLRKVGASAPGGPSQNSISALPTGTKPGWAAETDADSQAVSAVCPNCSIVIAEGASDHLADLSAAANAAVAAGATIVNASFGAPEDASQQTLSPAFPNATNIRFIASSGDNAGQVQFPASLPSTIAVAGTTLSVQGQNVTETLWSGSGYGCSSLFARPSWQIDSGCRNRFTADLAAVGDPNNGIAFYDSTLQGQSGWNVIGGTSVSAPIVAGLYAISGDTSGAAGASHLYANATRFQPIAPAGQCPNWPLVCQPAPGGLGIPQGLDGF